ncbi:transposase [Accumulibacter sp.]|uniref:transposase n=1 Tax=Accumulibacter sp. TaxID=2053492 RepID=UPI00258FCDE5|nr:transposase [Accumulibacter sp.]
MDGAYVGGKVRPENSNEDRVDRRLAENQDPDKRCILVMRQAHTEAEVEAGNAGAKKTLTFIVKNENQADLGKLAPAYIAQGSMICADESDAYDRLPAKYAVRRVNHGKAYRADDGTTNNLAESYFSRFRRFHIGQIRQAAPTYLDHHANAALPHLLDHDGGRFQAPTCRQRFADLAAAQRCALSLAEDVQNHALAFPRPEETAPQPVGLGPGRPQVDCRGEQLEGGVKVGQIIRQMPHFLRMMLDQPSQFGALADQCRNHGALRQGKCSRSLKTGEFSPGRGAGAGGGCSIVPRICSW